MTEQDQSSITIQLTSDDHTRPQYPYEFTFTAHIVAGEGSLTYTLNVENRNAEIVPIAPGFHPYFSVAQEDKSDIGIEGRAGIDPKAIQWATQLPNKIPFLFRIAQHSVFPSTAS